MKKNQKIYLLILNILNIILISNVIYSQPNKKLIDKINNYIFDNKFDLCEKLIKSNLKVKNTDMQTKEELNFKYGTLLFNKGAFQNAIIYFKKCNSDRKIDAEYMVNRCEIYLSTVKNKDIFDLINIKVKRTGKDNLKTIDLSIDKDVRILILKSRNMYVRLPKNTVLISDRLKKKINRTVRYKFSYSKYKVKVTNYGRRSYYKIITPENQFVNINNKLFKGEILVKPVNESLIYILEIPLEDYLKGVLSKEVPSSWPLESLKAQAVLARTYAVYHMIKQKYYDYDLQSTYLSQVFQYSKTYASSIEKAVEETKNIVVCYESKPIIAYFHADSGGQTETSENVWDNKRLPYLKSVKDEFGKNSKRRHWQKQLSEKYIRDKLYRKGYHTGKIKKILPYKRSQSNRILLFKIVGRRKSYDIKGNTFRMIIGSQFNIKSLLIDKIIKKNNGFLFIGRGSGHGVGLAQWSAKEMAEQGYDYKKIINYFYDKIEFLKNKKSTGSLLFILTN